MQHDRLDSWCVLCLPLLVMTGLRTVIDERTPRGDDAFGGTAVNGCWKYRRSGRNLDDVDENTVDWLVGESGGTGIKAELKDTSVTGGLLFGKIFIQHEPVAYSF
jgi:hypothetical protein